MYFTQFINWLFQIWPRYQAARAINLYSGLAVYWREQNCPTTAEDMDAEVEGWKRRLRKMDESRYPTLPTAST